ncbi:MAG: hypothetical protein ACR2HI_01935 [Gaiella sp.]
MVRVPAVAVLATVVGALSVTSAHSANAVQVTFVGDSVPASLEYVPSAERALRRGLDVRLDLEVCRRLVQPSCTFNGAVPTTALEAVQSYGHSLGEVLVVDVGYNESTQGYRSGIDRMMRAALAQGAHGVVWVTLQERRDVYRGTNTAIRAAARRWPQLQIADWNAHSLGKPWFKGDGLHLGTTGANALAAFLRPFILRAAA